MSVQSKPLVPKTMKPKAFSLADSDIERLERLQHSIGEVRGRAFQSGVVRAALLAFEKLPQNKQVAMLVSAEKELA